MSCRVHSDTGRGSEDAMHSVDGVDRQSLSPPRHKGGRKSNASSEARKQRNRQAQAAFRERRTEYIKHLEEEISAHEAKHRRLQAAHRTATDECLMMRYKNSLLERILLEKGIDVRAELQAKIEVPALPLPEPQPSFRRKIITPRSRYNAQSAPGPASNPIPRASVESTASPPSSVSSKSSPASTCSCTCDAHPQQQPIPRLEKPIAQALPKANTSKIHHHSVSEVINRNGKRSRLHSHHSSPHHDYLYEQNHDTQTTITTPPENDQAPLSMRDMTDNNHSSPQADICISDEVSAVNHSRGHSHMPQQQRKETFRAAGQRQVLSPADDSNVVVPGFQTMTQMLQPYDFMLDMESFGSFNYDSPLTC